MELAGYIHQLLFEHDCVIVPNFGGFVANYKSAQVNNVRHSFAPPTKKILFNKSLVANDGLLCHHIAMVNEITYEQAVSYVFGEVNTWQTQLQNHKTLDLLKVGSLVLDVEDKLHFSQNPTENYLLDSFGLGSFQAIPIKRDSAAKLIKKQFKDRKLVVVKQAKQSINYKRITTYAIAALFLIGAFLIPTKTDVLHQINYASLNPVSFFTTPELVSNSNLKFEEITTPTIATYESLLKTNDVVEVGFVNGLDKKMVVANKTTLVKETPAPTYAKGYKYYIVAGCFQEKSNADNKIKSLKAKGYNAVIIDRNKYGLYRVGYQGFTDKMKALEALLNIKIEDNQAAWMLSI